jgi:hypothetical protein
MTTMKGGEMFKVKHLVVTLVAAMLFPAVGAAGIGPAYSTARYRAWSTTCHQYCSSVPEGSRPKSTGRPTAVVLRPRVVTVAASSGFSWDDAAIGFGTASALALLTIGALAYRRRSAVHGIRQPA